MIPGRASWRIPPSRADSIAVLEMDLRGAVLVVVNRVLVGRMTPHQALALGSWLTEEVSARVANPPASES